MPTGTVLLLFDAKETLSSSDGRAGSPAVFPLSCELPLHAADEDPDRGHAPGACATVTVAEPDTPPAVAVTTAVPLLRAVTRPAESTAATPG